LIIKKPSDENICIVPDSILAETDSYSLYLGRGENSAEALLCRVVKTTADNGLMYAEKMLLDKLSKLSAELESERIAKQGDDGRRIHYDWLFPVCDESFSCREITGRRINTFKVLDASWDTFVPFSKLKRDIKVDAKSAAWVLGRFLKLQAFLDESEYCHSFSFNPDMVLIAPRAHRMVYIGWFDILKRSSDNSLARTNIDSMLDATSSWTKRNDEDGEDEYLNWLSANKGRFDSGLDAHVAYYDFLNELWGKGYHPFTFNKDGVWKSVNNYV